MNPSATTPRPTIDQCNPKTCFVFHNFPRCLYHHKQSYSTHTPIIRGLFTLDSLVYVEHIAFHIDRLCFDLSYASLVFCARGTWRLILELFWFGFANLDWFFTVMTTPYICQTREEFLEKPYPWEACFPEVRWRVLSFPFLPVASSTFTMDMASSMPKRATVQEIVMPGITPENR